MPSKPLFGMPVVVGMSEAVIAMRSMVSAAADAASASEPVNATARQAGESSCGRSDLPDTQYLLRSKKRASRFFGRLPLCAGIL